MVDLQTEVKVDISFNTQNSVESANLITVCITTSIECSYFERKSQTVCQTLKGKSTSTLFCKIFIVKPRMQIHSLLAALERI